jgi:hypothetical protein
MLWGLPDIIKKDVCIDMKFKYIYFGGCRLQSGDYTDTVCCDEADADITQRKRRTAIGAITLFGSTVVTLDRVNAGT